MTSTKSQTLWILYRSYLLISYYVMSICLFYVCLFSKKLSSYLFPNLSFLGTFEIGVQKFESVLIELCTVTPCC